jgi:hypothetical protein
MGMPACGRGWAAQRWTTAGRARRRVRVAGRRLPHSHRHYAGDPHQVDHWWGWRGRVRRHPRSGGRGVGRTAVAPRIRLNSLNANDYTKILELEYITSDASGDEFGDTFVDLRELRPLPAAARSAECSPALPIGEPERLCRRVVTPSGATVWRSWADSNRSTRQTCLTPRAPSPCRDEQTPARVGRRNDRLHHRGCGRPEHRSDS